MKFRYLPFHRAPRHSERRPGYYEEIYRRGKIVERAGLKFLEISEADFQHVRREFTQGGGLGDLVHKVAGPIGSAIKWPCVKRDGSNELVPGSPCDRARRALNRIKI